MQPVNDEEFDVNQWKSIERMVEARKMAFQTLAQANVTAPSAEFFAIMVECFFFDASWQVEGSRGPK